MRWFARCYDKVMAYHHYAHQIVAPYKQAAAALTRQWRRRASVALRRLPGARGVAAHYQGVRARKG
jgi:hypothetical protein